MLPEHLDRDVQITNTFTHCIQQHGLSIYPLPAQYLAVERWTEKDTNLPSGSLQPRKGEREGTELIMLACPVKEDTQSGLSRAILPRHRLGGQRPVLNISNPSLWLVLFSFVFSCLLHNAFMFPYFAFMMHLGFGKN